MKKNRLLPKSLKLISTFVICFVWFSSIASFTNSDKNDPHNSANCASCHSFSSQRAVKSVKSNVCLSCHSNITESLNFQNINVHLDLEQNCVDCHSFHDKSYLHVDNQKFKYDFSDENAHARCLTCHQNVSSLSYLSDGHKEARKLYHTDKMTALDLSPSQTCMVCHGGEDMAYNDKTMQIDKNNAPHINNHASHPYEISIQRGKGNSTNFIKHEINPEITLFKNQIECQSCHVLNNENDNLLVNSENESIFCNGCHVQNGNKVDYADTH